MMTRPIGRPAGTSSAANPGAANSGAANSGALRTVATLAATSLVLTGCGSLAASSGPARTGAASANAAASVAHGTSSADGTAQRLRKTVPTRALLCQHLLAPLSVRIVRIGGPVVIEPASGDLPGGGVVGQGAGGFAESVTVTDSMARSVAEAACALPVRPRGIRLCPPALQYHQYHLTFTIPGRVLPVVTVHAGGCPQVTGLGPVRWLVPGQSFLAELGRIAAVSGSGQPVKLPLHGELVHRLSGVAG